MTLSSGRPVSASGPAWAGEALNSPLVIIDGEARIRQWNRAAAEVLQLSRGDVGTPITELGVRFAAESILRKARRLLRNGKPFTERLKIGRRVFYMRGSAAGPGAELLFLDATGISRSDERLHEKESRRAEIAELHKATLDAIPGQAALLSQEGVILAVNAKWLEFSTENGAIDPDSSVGQNYLEVCERAAKAGDRNAVAVAAGLRAVLDGTIPRFTEDYPCHSPERERWFQCSITSAAGPARRCAVVFHSEITDVVIAREKVKRQDTALQSSASAIFIVDTEGRIDWVNEAFERISGYTAAEVNGHGEEIAHCWHGMDVLRDMVRASKGEAVVHGEVNLTNKSGGRYLVNQTITPIRSTMGDVTHFVVIHEDITHERQLRSQMQFMAEHDELTGAWNRKSFHGLLARAIGRHEGSPHKMAVLFVDIDRFKDTNDRLGHRVGDKVLMAVAWRLRQSLREQDTVARVGGDEFAILVEGLANRDEAMRIAESLLGVFQAPVEAEDLRVPITASVGATVFPDDGTTADTLLRNAEVAVYQAKVSGRRGHRLFDRELESEMRERMKVERELAHCVRDSQLWVAFQPQTRLDSGMTAGAECLLRWSRSAALGVSISTVVRIAEQCGMILPIGDWVLEESFAQLEQWHSAGFPIEMALNLSAVQIHEQDVFGILTGLGERHQVPLQSVKVELTESVLLNRTSRVKETLQALRRAGVGLVLDDFGTGYASLSYLQQFPIGTVKIDSSFVSGIGGSASDEAIVRGIVKLAHSLGHEVVAEGVETQLQVDFLRSCGCDQAQGFLLGRPLPASEFLDYLNRRRGTGKQS